MTTSSRITALPAATAVTADDLFVIVDDPAGTPVSKKVTEAVLAAGPSFATRYKLFVNVKAYGAVGDGVTDDTTAIHNAMNVNLPVFFPAGTYVYTGAAGLNPLYWVHLFGAGTRHTTISISAGQYFINQAVPFQKMEVEGIRFAGGEGVFKSTWSSYNILYQKSIRHCAFDGYTKAAISSDATDECYWNISECQFDGANNTTSIAIALNGMADASNIEKCTFWNHRVSIKLRRAYSVRIISNDFIHFAAATGGSPRTNIWFCPISDSNGGSYSAIVQGNKFGNENFDPTDTQILIADDLTPLGAVGDSFPNVAADSTATFSGFHFINNNHGGGGTTGVPWVYSTTPQLIGGLITGSHAGTPPAYIVQFRTAPSENRTANSTTIGPIQANVPYVYPWKATNCLAQWGFLNDPAGLFRGDAVTEIDGPGDPAEIVNLTPTALPPAWSHSLHTHSATTDRLGGATDVSEITTTAATGTTYAYLSVTPTVGSPAWLEFDMKQGAVSPLPKIDVWVRYDGNSNGFFLETIEPTAGWTRYRFPIRFPTTASNIIIGFYNLTSPIVGSFKFGRVKMYHSRAPISVTPAFPIAVTGTVAPAAGGAGALPATPLGYAVVLVNGVERKVAYY